MNNSQNQSDTTQLSSNGVLHPFVSTSNPTEHQNDHEFLLIETLKHSDILHFIYFPDIHRYRLLVVTDDVKKMPAAMDEFPESFIKYTHMNNIDAGILREAVTKIDNGAAKVECVIRIKYLEQFTWYRFRMINLTDENGNINKSMGYAMAYDQVMEAKTALHKERLHMDSIRRGTLASSCFNVSRDYNVQATYDNNMAFSNSEYSDIYNEAILVEPDIAYQAHDTLDILLSAASQIPDHDQRLNFIVNSSHIGLIRLYESGLRQKTLTYRRHTGLGLIWVQTKIVLLSDPDTNDILAFFYTSDVNDQTIYQKISEQILDKNYNAVAYYDINNHTFFYKSANASDNTFFIKMSYDEIVNRSILNLTKPDNIEEIRKKTEINQIINELEKSGSYSFVFTCNERDNTILGNPNIHKKIDAYYLDGCSDIIVFMFSDVTAIYEQEQHRLHDMQNALQAAALANDAKSSFLSSMSHDLRTPLNGVIGFTELALNESDPEILKSYLKKIQSSGQLLMTLINDTLELSRIESGKVILDPEIVDSSEIGEAVVTSLRPSAELKKIKLNADSSAFPVETLWLDKLKTQKIFLNLISNAIKYTPEGGTVDVKVIKLNDTNKKCTHRIIISDTGIGIGKDFIPKLFDPFTQEMRPEAQNIAGTGLGLTIVKKTVDLMHGTIDVKSEIGKGTTFTVDLPIKTIDSSNIKKDTSPVNAVSLEGKRILLCEDNYLNMEIASALLQSQKIIIDEAVNGNEGFDKFKNSSENYYDAILMDVRMPVMNGIEAVKKIRALNRMDAADIPIIAMSADAFEEDKKRAADAGMTDYLTKPVEPYKLVNVLCKHIKTK